MSSFKKTLTQVLTVLTVITTIWGVVAIFKDVAEWTSKTSAAYITSAAFAAACVPMLVSFFKVSFGKLFGLEDSPSHILLHASQQWRIASDQSAEVVSEKKMFFTQPPARTVLYDIAFGSETLDVYKPNYASTDARITSVEKLPSGYLRVYWQPRSGAIKPGEPYQHHCKVHFPAPKSRGAKVITIAAAIYTVKLEMNILSDLPLRGAKLVRGEENQLLQTPEEVQGFVSSARETGAPPPDIAGNRITFVLEEIPPRCPYYLVVYFAPEPEAAPSNPS
jgi:hypothetical protein